MPILWRYLLAHYLKVLLFTTFTFISLLFATRFSQIAEFAALGASGSQIALFALTLIPYILPIALPIACLISAIILFQRLSCTQELSAMRAAGLSLSQLAAPILLAGAALCLLNFYATSELATHAYMLGRKMKTVHANVNPLLLLQKTHLFPHTDIYVDMRTVKAGESVDNLTLFFYNPDRMRLNLVHAKSLHLAGDTLYGKGISLAMGFQAGEGEGFDPLMIENQTQMSTQTASLTHLLQGFSWQPKNHYLRLRLLMLRMAKEREALLAAGRSGLDPKEQMKLASRHAKGYSEIWRRVSLALAALTFTYLGCAFGVTIGRTPTRKKVVECIALTALFIVAYLLAYGLDDHLVLSATLYLAPHIVLVGCATRAIWRSSRGCEG